MDKIIYSETVTAGVGGLTANRCVKFDGTTGNALGGKVMGIAEYDVTAGDVGAVAMIGTKTAEAGGAFSRGDDLVCDASGRLVVNPAIGGEFVVGEALEAAAAAGDMVEVFLRRQST